MSLIKQITNSVGNYTFESQVMYDVTLQGITSLLQLSHHANLTHRHYFTRPTTVISQQNTSISVVVNLHTANETKKCSKLYGLLLQSLIYYFDNNLPQILKPR